MGCGMLLVASTGFLVLVKLMYLFSKWVYVTFLRPQKKLKESYGSWALITGATEGIGKALARQLALNGLNLILLSRNQDKLKRVSREIQTESPLVQIKTFEIDFLSCNPALEKILNNEEIGVVINNVGITYPKAMYFHEVDHKLWLDIVKVNVRATTAVVRAAIPGMVRRRRGAIVNVGSGAASVVPSHPLYAVYAATKAYVDQFSRSLHVEYKEFGVDVQCQVPLYVATRMASKVAGIETASLFVPSADGYAKAAVRLIGHEARCVPYWSHAIQQCFVRLLPEVLLDNWRLAVGLRRRSCEWA